MSKAITLVTITAVLIAIFATESQGAALLANKSEAGIHTGNVAKLELVAGFFLYRVKNQQIEYLLIKKKGEDDWTPPKGRLEDNEDQMVSAVRETLEETSIYPTHYDIWNFLQIVQYQTGGGNDKRVDLWPARLHTPDHPIIIDPEEQDTYEWLAFPEAQSTIKSQFRNAFVITDEYVRQLESF